MDRLSQLRGGAGGSRDGSLDGSSAGDSFMTANDTPSKYYSLSEDDSFDITKDVSLASTSSENTLNDSDCFSNLSPIGKKELLDYKIGKQIEAANILSGGVNIFDDNESSYDGNELVIDDNVEIGDTSVKSPTLKSSENPVLPLEDDIDKSSDLKLPDSSDLLQDDSVEAGMSSTLKPGCSTLTSQDTVETEKSPDLKSPESSELVKVDEQVNNVPDLPLEQADELMDGDALDQDAQVAENELPLDNGDEQVVENNEENENRTEVVLQIDGNNVDAINIGTGLYLYRKQGQEELAAVQIVEDEEPSFKFLKVRENAEGNLEVYEEIQEVIVVPQEMPIREARPPAPSAPREPNRPVNVPSTSKPVEEKNNAPDKEEPVASTSRQDNTPSKDAQKDAKSERNVNGKMVKISESRKSPLMAYHSTPNKEGIPLTKTMVDQQLHPNRHSDNIKKTIEVHTDNSKQKISETPTKSKDVASPDKVSEEVPRVDKTNDKETSAKKHISIVTKENISDVTEKKIDEVAGCSNAEASHKLDAPKAKEEEAKASSEKDEETVGKSLVVTEGEKKMTVSSKDSESPSAIPQSNVCSKILDGSIDNKIEDKEPSNETTNKESVAEKPTPTISSVETSHIDKLEVKIPEIIEYKENPGIVPAENVESDDVDEDALVIEESVIDCQPEIKAPENKDSEPEQSSPEIPSKGNGNLDKNDLEGAKPSNVVEPKVNSVEIPDTSKPSQIETTSANPATNCNINVMTKDKIIIENKPDNKLNTQNSLSNNELKCTNSKDTQLTNNIKKIEITEAKESGTPVKENLINNLEEVNAKDTLTENKAAAVESAISNAKFNDASKTLQAKPDGITSKSEPSIKKPEDTNVSNAKDVKATSLLPIKQRQPSNLPKVTPNVAKPPIKLNVKPMVVNAAETKKELNPKLVQNAIDTKPKSINNNHAPVPFGKWTEANRQDFLNKIKESKVPVNMSNANQLKQPNDLNRRDVLKKIDSQRQTYNANVKIQESLQKGNVKTETAFASKIAPATVPNRETKVPTKSDTPILKHKPIVIKKPVQEPVQTATQETTVANTVSSTTKNETQRKEINNQDLIDKTIEGIINRAVTGKSPEDVKQTATEKPIAEKVDKKPEPKTNSQPTLLDAIEMKMNELHGIPFVERPPHELPRPYLVETSVSPKNETQNVPQKVNKIPNLLPLTKSQQKLKDCEDDIVKLDTPREKSSEPTIATEKSLAKAVPSHEQNKTSKDTIITETEFDKFARRNSVTYENCLTVTDSHQVIQTVIPREAPPKKISRNEQMLAEAKAKSPHKHLPLKQYHPSKASSKFTPVSDQNKQYQSKLQLAYQTAITAKRRIESPITIIEDKPVKVVYLDPNVSEFSTGQLNVQGRDLSPAKRPEPDVVTVGTGDSLDSDILEAMEDVRPPEDTRTKSKHQRKQVLTPVETPDLELIEPGDLGIEVSPKKKRKLEDKTERSPKNLVPKKSYLLGRSAAPARPASESVAAANVPPPEVTLPTVPPVTHNASSAIDNLVKAAELLENQSESMNTSNASVESVDGAQGTPVKRGRGRPRKHPLPAGSELKASPQKKPRFIDAETKHISSSDDDSSDDDSMIKENWTMGKINEKIVCPICNKLFRSENVVFKHVKHCAGPSPSRSDQDKRSPRRSRLSQESETHSRDSEVKSCDSRQDEPEDNLPLRKTPRKRKSKDSGKSSSSYEVIPVEPKETDGDDLPKKHDDDEPRKIIRPRINPRTNNLVCEICGKSFRQRSYLDNHMAQHKKDDAKKAANDAKSDKSVIGCETCKKEFRKLHHLVQHRLIHTPVQSRALRKTSSEQKELPKGQDASKMEDQSAGFRCEPCDKSFRKLHHLVEHRETHDGINRQRSNSVTQVVPEKEKPTPPPQCDICKKTFRKLHHLIEHKEQHLETSSEKSDDQKSVKSSLSTKDIIHECNLCYMVFPNEHSLNKHAVNCLRKKKQSAAKQAATLEDKNAKDGAKAELLEENKEDSVKEQEPMETDVEEKLNKAPEKPIDLPAKVEVPQIKEPPPKPEIGKNVDKEEQVNEPKPAIEKKAAPLPEPIPKVVNKPLEPAKIKQVDEIIVIEDTPKKVTVSRKVPIKDKVAATVTKRQKVATAPPVEERIAPAPSSDEDEVRYMINPDFKTEETAESKNFLKVRAKKRSSLQIERPNSKDLVRRRSLLQQPTKSARLRAKSDDVVPNSLPKPAIKPKVEKVEVPSTDSDDSDVKYSFPKTIPEKPAAAVKQEPVADDKKRRKTMVEKRKSLGGIAKRKSLGKAIVKPAAKPTPANPIKRRTMVVEHRCDCGALFSSAALLARHASLAHTPPRVRRRRDPAPSPCPAPPRATQSRKSSARSDGNDKPKPTRKSTIKDSARKPDTKTPKSRNRVHSGVPLPEKRVPRK